MKSFQIAWITSLLTVASFAEIEIPRSVYKTDQLDAAAAEAAKEKKGLAFVMTDPGTSCGLCIGASEMAFKSLKSHSVVVLVNSEDKQRWKHLGPMVVTGLSEKKMGNFIPTACITSPDMSELWGQMSYQDLKEDGSYRTMRKQVDAILKGEAKPETHADRLIYWPAKGSDTYYIGSFIGLTENHGLRLKMQKGNKVSVIPLDRLTDHCASLARKLAGVGTSATPQSAASETPAFEVWTGSNGKTLKARFIGLQEQKVMLEFEDGKTQAVPLERLANESRERAEALHKASVP